MTQQDSDCEAVYKLPARYFSDEFALVAHATLAAEDRAATKFASDPRNYQAIIEMAERYSASMAISIEKIMLTNNTRLHNLVRKKFELDRCGLTNHPSLSKEWFAWTEAYSLLATDYPKAAKEIIEAGLKSRNQGVIRCIVDDFLMIQRRAPTSTPANRPDGLTI